MAHNTYTYPTMVLDDSTARLCWTTVLHDGAARLCWTTVLHGNGRSCLGACARARIDTRNEFYHNGYEHMTDI